MAPPRHLAALVACLAAACSWTGEARAHHWQPGSCGLPEGAPLRVEYAEIATSHVLRNQVFAPAASSLVLATSGPWLPEKLRQLGARTVFWHMNLDRVAGVTRSPAPAEGVEAAADRLADRAIRETGCQTPLVALNELQGAWLPTPWSPWNAHYRANVLAVLRRLHDRGARPFLLVTTSRPPFTESPEAQEWWRAVAAVSDVVLQVHFNGPYVARQGPVLGSRLRRQKMRAVLERFDALGIPSERLGLLHGFQSGRGSGGREGLPLATWLRVVKWEGLALQAVAAERAAEGKPLGSDWSWGWGDFPKLSRPDPDKHVTACTWLWVRDPALCDAPRRARRAGVRLNRSRTEGQVRLAPDVVCRVGRPRRAIGTVAVERLAAVEGPPPLGRIPAGTALAALFARTVGWAAAPVRLAAVLAAERRVVRDAFGGSREAYEAALAERGAGVEVARGVLLDQILARRARGADPLERARRTATCVRDAVPPAYRPDLTPWLPFLRLR